MQAGDWVLVSLQPFDTEETLTITMNNGDQTELKVTDAQDAPMKDDGVTVDSITNPAGAVKHPSDPVEDLNPANHDDLPWDL